MGLEVTFTNTTTANLMNANSTVIGKMVVVVLTIIGVPNTAYHNYVEIGKINILPAMQTFILCFAYSSSGDANGFLRIDPNGKIYAYLSANIGTSSITANGVFISA